MRSVDGIDLKEAASDRKQDGFGMSRPRQRTHCRPQHAVRVKPYFIALEWIRMGRYTMLRFFLVSEVETDKKGNARVK